MSETLISAHLAVVFLLPLKQQLQLIAQTVFLVGLYYDSIQNDIGAERAFLEANRLNAATPSSLELAEPVDVVAEVEGDASEPGIEEPVGEGPPWTGASDATRMAEVHGNCHCC